MCQAISSGQVIGQRWPICRPIGLPTLANSTVGRSIDQRWPMSAHGGRYRPTLWQCGMTSVQLACKIGAMPECAHISCCGSPHKTHTPAVRKLFCKCIDGSKAAVAKDLYSGQRGQRNCPSARIPYFIPTSYPPCAFHQLVRHY
jgi:hypothetical protein